MPNDVFKGQAMNRAWSILLQGCKVSNRSIALVLIKTIDWIHFMEGPHDSVPVYLGKDRGSRDAATDLVALFEAFLSDGDGNRVDPVNKKDLRSRVKGLYRARHGLE